MTDIPTRVGLVQSPMFCTEYGCPNHAIRRERCLEHQPCQLCDEILADFPGFSAKGMRRLHENHGHDRMRW